MAKGYWVVTYRAIHDRDKLAAYAELAGPAVNAAGGKFLVRGNPSKVYESGQMQRVVVIEFDSLDKALAAHDTPAYREALDRLADGVDREIRVVEGVA